MYSLCYILIFLLLVCGNPLPPLKPLCFGVRSVMAPAHQWIQLTVMQNCTPKCYFECVDVSKLG